MTEKGTNHQRWLERSLRTVDFGGGYQVTIRIKNELALMFNDDGLPNPLTSVIMDHMGEHQLDKDPQELNMGSLLGDVTKTAALRNGLRDLLIEVIVDPPLLEQGNPDGVPVDTFRLDEQMRIFEEIFGGKDQLAKVEGFPAEQNPDMDLT